MHVLGLAGNIGSGKDTVAKILKKDYGFLTIAFADALKRITGKLFMFSKESLYGSVEDKNKLEARASTDAYWQRVRRNQDHFLPLCVELFKSSPLPLEASTIEKALHDQIQWCYENRGQFTPRLALQRMGTEWGRALWPDVWIHQVQVAIEDVIGGRSYSRVNGIEDQSKFPEQDFKGITVSDARFVNEAQAIHSWKGKVAWIDASKRHPSKNEPKHASEPKREDFKIDSIERPNGIDLIDYDLDNNDVEPKLHDSVKRLVETLFPDVIKPEVTAVGKREEKAAEDKADKPADPVAVKAAEKAVIPAEKPVVSPQVGPPVAPSAPVAAPATAPVKEPTPPKNP